MHPNQTFRRSAKPDNVAFARQRAFGVLVVNNERAPLISHIPFLLNETGSEAELHLVRSNSIARACQKPTSATIVVSGPDGYVSPDWYGVDDQVPTWNYVAVHITGTLVPLSPDQMRPMLDHLTAHFEQQLAPKPAWVMDKMTPDVLSKMMRQILPFRLDVTGIDGTWKLSQNKPDAVRRAAAKHMEHAHIGSELLQLSALMIDPPS